MAPISTDVYMDRRSHHGHRMSYSCVKKQRVWFLCHPSYRADDQNLPIPALSLGKRGGDVYTGMIKRLEKKVRSSMGGLL